MSTIKYFVYEWINIANGKKYIGKHCGYENDGYIGSGKYFLAAYKKEPENFKRIILGFYEDNKSMNIAEETFLIEVDAVNNPDYYNLTNLSGGGNLHSHLSPERRKEIIDNARIASLEHLKNNLENIKQKKKFTWINSPKRELHSINTKERRIKEELNKTPEDRLKFSEKCKDSYWKRDKEDLEKHHKKISSGVKDSYKNIPGLLQSRKDHFKNINTGRIAINKNGIIKRIYPEQKEEYLSNGWKLGMGARKNKINH